MKKKKCEADFQAKFTPWAKENWVEMFGRVSAAVELKKSDTSTLGWSKIEPHQYTEMDKAQNSVMVHKISDSAVGYKPVDTVIIAGLGYLGVMFNIQKQMKVFYIINITYVKFLKNVLKKKSLSEQDCNTFGHKITL